MSDFDPTKFHGAFLAANANERFIVVQLADVIRDLMRAVSSDNSSGGVYSAAEKMGFVGELLTRCQEPLSWRRLLKNAVEEIKANIPDDPDDRRLVEAATRGINAARGRASRRLQEFRDAVFWSMESRGKGVK